MKLKTPRMPWQRIPTGKSSSASLSLSCFAWPVPYFFHGSFHCSSSGRVLSGIRHRCRPHYRGSFGKDKVPLPDPGSGPIDKRGLAITLGRPSGLPGPARPVHPLGQLRSVAEAASRLNSVVPRKAICCGPAPKIVAELPLGGLVGNSFDRRRDGLRCAGPL